MKRLLSLLTKIKKVLSREVRILNCILSFQFLSWEDVILYTMQTEKDFFY